MQFCKGERKDNVAVEYLKRFKGEEGVLFRGAVQVDQVLLDPVTAEVAILLLDVLNGLLEIEPLCSCLASNCMSSIRSQRASASSANCSPSGECLHSRRSSRKGLFANVLSPWSFTCFCAGCPGRQRLARIIGSL
jgi:hypothetical protein